MGNVKFGLLNNINKLNISKYERIWINEETLGK